MKHSAYNTNLDQFDVKILKALHRNGRITKIQLAEEIGLSSTPCWERMNKLERAGVIEGYHAVLDYRKLLSVSYFRVFVTIQNYSLAISKDFEKMVQEMPEVMECEAVLGKSDYVIKIMADSVDEYVLIMEGILGKVEIDYQTLPVSKSVKYQSDVNLAELYARFISG